MANANKFFSNASGSQLANNGDQKRVWGADATTGTTATNTPTTTTTVTKVQDMAKSNTGLLVIGAVIGAVATYLYIKKMA